MRNNLYPKDICRWNLFVSLHPNYLLYILPSSFKIDCYDHDDDGGHDLIGSCTTNVRQMIEANKHEISLPCINPKKQQKKKSYVNSGIIIISYSKVS